MTARCTGLGCRNCELGGHPSFCGNAYATPASPPAPTRVVGRAVPPPAEAYQGLTDRAKAFVAARKGALSKICGCPDGAWDVDQWAKGRAVPTYEQARRILSCCDGLALEDFGYTERADGRVARLLAPGHAPAPPVFVRASGDCRCEHCGRAYHRHPAPPAGDLPGLVLHVLCDGRRVKL